MKLTDIFGYEDGLLYNIKTNHIYCNLDRDGYIRVRISGKEYRAHRLIWEMFNGPIPTDMLIDHLDGDVFNNRLENLRLVTRQQNNANSLGDKNKDLPKGVTKNPSGKFRARTTIKGTTYSLGTFSTADLAAEAIKIKNNELNGEYSVFRSRKLL